MKTLKLDPKDYPMKKKKATKRKPKQLKLPFGKNTAELSHVRF